jgi:Ca2+-binding EF-hand superfamily protein
MLHVVVLGPPRVGHAGISKPSREITMQPSKHLALAFTALAALFSSAASSAGDAFAKMDTDGDGRITAAEHARGVRAMFLAMDRDGDGRVTAAEMTAAQSRVGSGSPESRAMPSADKIRAVDRNQDKVLTLREHVAGGRDMFARMDTNRDGALVEAEYAAGQARLMARR